MDETREAVARLVTRLRPEPVCPACLAALVERGEGDVAIAMHALAGHEGFVRAREACSLCGTTGPVMARR
jgi:ribosomal protein S27AE